MTQPTVLAKPARTTYSGDDEVVSAYWFECSLAVLGGILFMGAILTPAAAGLALGVWVAGAILGPTIVSFSIVGACA